MKKRYFLIPLLGVLCLCLAFALAGCSKDDEGEVGLGDGWIKDQYGYARPENCWLTETLILAEEPLSEEKMFGTGGESGLASEWAMEKDGQLSDTNTYYLVCLVYGTPNLDSEFDTDLNFLLIQDTAMVYNSFAVDIGEPRISGDLEIDYFRTSMLSPPVLELKSGFRGENGEIQGMLVIPFSMKNANSTDILYVDLNLNEYMESSLNENDNSQNLYEKYKEHYKVDAQEMVCFESDSNRINAEISNVSVRYLTRKAYDDGNYSEEAFTDAAVFENNEFCYMMLEFTTTTLADNDGTHSLRVTTVATSRNCMAMRIEDAPTGTIKEMPCFYDGTSISDGATMIHATYNLPAAASEQKKVRMFFSLRPISGGSSYVQFFFSGGKATNIVGEFHIGQEVTAPANKEGIYYELNEDENSYSVSGITAENETVIIPNVLSDGLPVTGIKKISSKKVSTIVIPDGVTAIGERAFEGCSNLVMVYYGGNATDWSKISIGSGNTDILSATLYYYSAEKPTEAGNWWHYAENGGIVTWPEVEG